MKINPLVALLFNIILPISIMFPGNKYKEYFFLAFASFILIICKKYGRLLKFAIAYGVLYGLNMMVVMLGGLVSAFFAMLFTVFMQFIPCMMMASILIFDYKSSELISALEPLHIPKSIVVALVIVIRYIPTFVKEFRDMKESMRLRNIPFSLKRPVKSFEYFIVPQLFRCSILSDEITAAGLTKGITNPAFRTSYYGVRMRSIDYLMCVILNLGMAVFLIWR